MGKFREFITEEKSDKYKIVVLTRAPEAVETTKNSFATSEKFEKAANKLGLKSYTCYIDGAYLTYENDTRTIHNADDEKGFEISPADTIIIVRGGVNQRDSWKDLLTQLEKNGYTCINSRECIETCSDKYRTALRLADHGLVTPTTVIVPNAAGALTAFEKLDTTYPVILKTAHGTKGIGVLFVESEKSLESMTQLLFKIDEEISLILQSFVKTDHDVRVMVLNNIIVGAMRRNTVKGDFRSNVHLGATVDKYELTDRESDDCIRAAKAVNGSWVGVDFIPAKNRDKEGPYILEVNSSPGTQGFDEALKMDITTHILENFKDHANWWKTPTLAGTWETFTHEKFGNLVGKMDTGNSSETSVIHADSYEIKDKKVIWKLNGKSETSDLIKVKEIKLGGFRNRDESRPMIRAKMSFNGQEYNMPFTIDDRGEKTPILVNRNFMRDLNLAIDANRKFVLTKRIELDTE